MPTYEPYLGTKPVDWADPDKALFRSASNIVKGEVRKVDTATRSGRLHVYIQGFSQASAQDPKGWFQVDYASPFAGKTLGPQAFGPANKQNDFTNTRQTYGFFMVPPDIGNIVLCCFPDGDMNKGGYWFACVNPNLGKNMTPSIGGLPLNRIDPISIPPSLSQFLVPGGTYPVGESNENDAKLFVSNWATDSLKPLHVPQFVRLVRQGLDTDANGRGVISSSIQRDPISSVFGFSTPGRPTNDTAGIPNLQSKLATGEFNPADYIVNNRVGGHSLTMDDGDIFGKSNLVKLKTAAGHQILMNDTDGFIYISNSEGTAWVELTKEGDVLVYSGKDLSIRTQGNLMMHSSRDISFNAGRYFNIKAPALRVETQGTTINSEQGIRLNSQNISVTGLAGVSVSAAKIGMTSAGPMSLVGGIISLNSGAPTGLSALQQQPERLNQYALPETLPSGAGWTVNDGKLFSINYKVPTHEPYIRGDIAAVVQQQQEAAQEFLSGTEFDIEGNPVNSFVNTNLTPGLDSSQFSPVDANKVAPTSEFIKQPTSLGIGLLDTTDTKAYFAQLGYAQTESNYKSTNTELGTIGKYNFSPAALRNLGYLKPTTPSTYEGLTNPNNWTGLNGATDPNTFLANPSVQERAVYDYTRNNYAKLQDNGLITDTSSKENVAGLLSASHLYGTDLASIWARENQNNGIDFNSPYNLGRYSQTQISIIQQSEESKQIVSLS